MGHIHPGVSFSAHCGDFAATTSRKESFAGTAGPIRINASGWGLGAIDPKKGGNPSIDAHKDLAIPAGERPPERIAWKGERKPHWSNEISIICIIIMRS